MKPLDRNISVLEHIVSYCQQIEQTIDRFGEEVSTVTVDDGRFKAIVEVAPSPPFFAWVFTFCGKIQILGPAEVLDEMRSMAAWLQ